MLRASLLFGTVLVGSVCALAACVGDEPQVSSNGTGDDGGTSSSGTGSSSGTSGGNSSSGNSSSGGDDGGSGCVAPLAACGGDGKCTTSTDTDPKHCGACNHDCAGGSCVGGMCQPVALQANVDAPAAIAVNSTAVFWLQAQATRKCPKSGCGGSPTMLSQATEVGTMLGPRQIVADEDNVYWLARTDGGPIAQVYIWKCATAGCSLSPTQHGSYAAGGALVGNATHLFRYDPSGSFYKYPKASTTPEYLTGLYLAESYGFAVDATTLAFTNTDESIQGNGGVYTAAITANAPTKIMDLGVHVTMTGGVVYASRNLNPSQSTIHRCPVAGGCGGTGTPLLTSPDGVITDVVADASGIYWTVRGTPGSATGAVRRCAVPDCAGGPKDLAKDQAGPVALALDGEFVYWANRGTGAINTGSIMRVRK